MKREDKGKLSKIREDYYFLKTLYTNIKNLNNHYSADVIEISEKSDKRISNNESSIRHKIRKYLGRNIYNCNINFWCKDDHQIFKIEIILETSFGDFISNYVEYSEILKAYNLFKL